MTEDEIKAVNANPLCDRLDEINGLAAQALRHRGLSAAVKSALEEIHALSVGFMKIPDKPGEKP